MPAKPETAVLIFSEAQAPEEFLPDFRGPLTAEDSWIKNFLGEEPSEDWLEAANSLVATGSQRLDGRVINDRENAIIDARIGFFEGMLGLGDPSHPLQARYKKMCDTPQRQNGIPIETFIGNMRVLAAIGVDGTRQFDRLHNQPEVMHDYIVRLLALGLDPTKIMGKYDQSSGHGQAALNRTFNLLASHGLPAVKMLNQAPRLIGYAEKTLDIAITEAKEIYGEDAAKIIGLYPSTLTGDVAAKRGRLNEINKVIAQFDWRPKNSPDLVSGLDLVVALPPVMGMSPEKFRAHKALFAQFGNKEMSVAAVAGLMTMPLESHVIALGINPGLEYSRKKLQSIVQHTPSLERAPLAAELIKRPEVAEVLGSRVVAAYQTYAEKEAAKKRR